MIPPCTQAQNPHRNIGLLTYWNLFPSRLKVSRVYVSFCCFHYALALTAVCGKNQIKQLATHTRKKSALYNRLKERMETKMETASCVISFHVNISVTVLFFLYFCLKK